MEKLQIIKKDNKEIKKNKRIVKLDIVRTFAILCVVLCHSCEAMYSMIDNNVDYIIISVLHTLSRLGVPLFLFLSGTLLLKKNINSDEDVKEFYKKNLLPLIITNIIWITIYNLFFLFTGQKEYLHIDMYIKELLFLKKVPVPNMWYLQMIIGLYLGIPFIAKIVKTFSVKSLKFIILFLLITNFIIPNINIFLDLFGIKTYLELLLNLNFLGGTYGVYIIIGYYIYHNKNNKDINSIILVGVVSFLIAFFKRLLLKDIWYNSLSLLIFGSCVYILFNKLKDERINYKIEKICTYISKTSLSLFFVHYIIQVVLIKYIEKLEIILLMKFLILYIGVVIISTIIIKIISKIRVISKYALLIK